jgi:hypothetical protein
MGFLLADILPKILKAVFNRFFFEKNICEGVNLRNSINFEENQHPARHHHNNH